MPSELEDLKRCSSSLSFSQSGSLPSERQLGFWESETTVKSQVNSDLVALSRLGKPLPVGSQMVKPLECPDSYPNQEYKVNCRLLHTDGEEAADTHSLTLLRPVNQDPISSTSYFAESKNNSMLGANYENTLFSSSLSELFCRKLRLSANNSLYDYSANSVASKTEQEEHLESLEEIEAQTIGDLLPNDDDLLSGMTEGHACIGPARNINDLDDLDIFSSIGGMDLDDDSSSARNLSTMPLGAVNNHLGLYNNSMPDTHPHEKHPSRALLVRNIDGDVEDFELQALFEKYGDLRTLYTARKQQGFVLIYYYDIRSAQNAIKALHNRPLRHKKLVLRYSIPKENHLEEDVNQSTLIVFNLDSSVSNNDLFQIFCLYGDIKEISNSPHGDDQKMIEFYDVRAAEAALQALNGSEIAGKRIKLELSRLEGRRPLVQQLTSELDQNELGIFLQQNSSPCKSTTGFSVPFSHNTVQSIGMENGVILGRDHAPRAIANPSMVSGFSTPNVLQSMLRVDPMGNQSGLAQHVQSQARNTDIQRMASFLPHSLPEYHDGLTTSSPSRAMIANYHHVRERMNNRQLHRASSNGQSAELNKTVLDSSSGGHPIPGHPFALSNSYQPQPTGFMYPNSPSPSFVHGIGSPHLPPQLHGFPRAPSQALNRVVPLNNHHVGSEPTIDPMWDMCHTYRGESTEASKFHPGSLGSIGASNNSPHSMEFVSRNIFPHFGGNYMDLSNHKNAGIQSPQQRSMMFPGRGHMTRMVNLFDSSSERARSRRAENCYNQADKKQFELDIERIMQGEDKRTTLMLKNIPNKYTSKMLLAAIDERHKGTYDFIYLPIDFKNKCNVGYAFINMTDPMHIIPFYQTFHGKKWEKFNSEKVASLAYARIQGKVALIAHFQNSSLMNEDKRCRPILFNTEGPNAGDQVPFPMGVNIRTRPGRSRTNMHEENHHGSPPSATNEENSTNGNISLPAKESD